MATPQELAQNNPLREGMRLEPAAGPCAMVIFGASGDLTRRKLIPALYNLMRDQRLSSAFAVIGTARTAKTDEVFRQEMRQAVEEFSRTKLEPQVWETFAPRLSYLTTDFNEDQTYAKLNAALASVDQQRGTQGNHIYYLATPPEAYIPIIEGLGRAGMNRPDASGHGWKRIIIEKPFGEDLESARELNRRVAAVFTEEQVYRIDHYLGKETVQNISVFRFSNGMFEPVWNRNYIDHVQITAAEEVGVGSRAGYYDKTGALRDMIQNHMLQVFALIAMEPPAEFGADAVRDEKVKVFKAIRPIEPSAVAENTVRAQYAEGSIGGKKVKGYLQEPGVNPNSTTETYAAIRFFVDNWRWGGVPFYIRSGKSMPRRITEVAIEFKKPPVPLFNEKTAGTLEPNLLVLRIQPDEGISIRIEVKIPGQRVRIRPVTLDFRYGSSFGVELSEAYERLLLDCMLGDSTLFTRRDGLETTWEFITKILQGWRQQGLRSLPQYEAGTWGPAEANALIERDGRRWRRS
ncbi:MAG TPA: glucose-6-phosphate dehydrogenase [Acidobacteriota bacterium]|jgi:glucose-6-phosphate 1-dehydrogenase